MTKRPKKQVPPSKRSLLVSRSLLLGLCALSLAGLFYSVHGLRPQETLIVGQPSPRTYEAPVGAEVVDQLLTERERQVARAQVPTLYTADPQLQRLVINAVSAAGLPAEVQDIVIATYREPEGITDRQRSELIERSVSISPPERQREVRLLLERRLIATSVANTTLTTSAKEAAAGAVRPVMQRVEAGQVIVREGEALSEDQLQTLVVLGLYNAQADVTLRRLRALTACLLLGGLFTLPLALGARHLALNPRQLVFLVALTLALLAVQRLALLVSPYFLVALLIPIVVAAFAPVLTAALWSAWLAAALAVVAPGGSLFMLLMALSGGVTASLLALRFQTRSSLLLAGVAGGLCAAVAYLLLYLLLGTVFTLGVAYNVLFLLAGGTLAGLLALGVVPLAEHALDFLTEFRLSDLASPSTPLLQKLLLEAPGTYQHSLIISNLVEQAVTNIGGNARLARVGALYHDVGKLKRPHLFVENQFSGDNPHDQLSPHLSYLVITSHVRDGLELVREYRLPKALEPFVAEHHGTTVLTYFYKRALEDSAKLDELNFRYPGPKPQTRESAVLMLADAVESASRTLTEPSQSAIRALIDRLFELRLQDGQLAECPLNFRDLEVIAATFERMLTAILHRRISYPSNEEILKLKRAGEPRTGENRGGDPQRNPAPAST